MNEIIYTMPAGTILPRCEPLPPEAAPLDGKTPVPKSLRHLYLDSRVLPNICGCGLCYMILTADHSVRTKSL